jgi:serine/threonine protein kinase
MRSGSQKNYRVLITDFGMAKMTQSPLERMQTRCGTLDYVAPEVMRPLTTKMTASSLENEQGGYSKQVDIWSLGVILFAMLVFFIIS